MPDAQDYIQQIEAGMPVVDSTGDTIGDVTFVHPGIDATGPHTVTQVPGESDIAIPQAVRDQLPEGSLPVEVRGRMVQLGFIRVGTGPLDGDHYVLTDQIAYVSDDTVHLRIAKNDIPIF